MKSRIKFIAAVAVGLVVTASLTACSGLKSLDVVGQQSIPSFDEVLKTIPDKVQADQQNAGWSLSAPDDSARFIWSEDYSNQDKDIVFVLNPEPLIAAGVAPDKIEGWSYAQVTVEENGKTEQVWKLLKPFDLK